MNRILVFSLAGVAVILILVTGAAITGFITFFPTDKGIVIGDDVEIKGTDLTACCTFTVDGVEKICSVLSPYTCDYCDPYC